MYQRVVVLFGILGVCISLAMGYYSVVTWEIVTVLISVCLGIPALILAIEKVKTNEGFQLTSPEPTQQQNEERLGMVSDSKEKGKKRNHKAMLLPDNSKITKLNIGNVLLNRLYEEAKAEADNRYNDALFSGFNVQVYPFFTSPNKVTIYLEFYSKLADRICKFRFRDDLSQVEHCPPDKHVEDDYERTVFSVLPWRRSPQWMRFLDLVYSRIGPFAPASGTNYLLFASRSINGDTRWFADFNDAFSGKRYLFEWNGEEIRNQNIKQLK